MLNKLCKMSKGLNKIISLNLIPALYFHKTDSPYVIVYSEQKCTDY